MNKEELQFIVDVINKEHDFYFEDIMHGNYSNNKNEQTLRKFLLTAHHKYGCDINRCAYDWAYKMHKLNSEEV